MKNDEQEVAISYFVEELEQSGEPDFNIDQLMAEIDNADISHEMLVPQMIHYHENCTMKELLLICEYYGFAKDLKHSKCNKEQIISSLVMFESDINNADIVFKRQNMWFYINELKHDKFMKKFVLW